MTDTGPPTTLSDIYSVGQRRAPGGIFPSGASAGSGGFGDTPGKTIELDDGDPDPSPGTDPCADPDSALEWNADAAAAEAMRKFRAKAAELGDDDLYEREFHAFLYRDSDGRIQVGGVSAGNQVGSNEESTVGRDWTGITPDNLVGSIHSHPGGSLTPSGSDWGAFDGIRSWIEQFSGTQSSNRYRHYIIARDITDSASNMIPRVYNRSSPRTDAPGPEVNPEGHSCP